jgi:hypothetical protein
MTDKIKTIYIYIVVSVHHIKEYRGSNSIVPLILNLCIKWRWVVNYMPWPFSSQEAPVLTTQEAKWAQEPVWMIMRRGQFLAPTQNRTQIVRLKAYSLTSLCYSSSTSRHIMILTMNHLDLNRNSPSLLRKFTIFKHWKYQQAVHMKLKVQWLGTI